MRSTVRNYVQAVKARREENGDEGFSLIELIVVVVILGILAAVAIPIFGGIQEQAKTSAREAAAANGASQAAAQIANNEAATLLPNTDDVVFSWGNGGAAPTIVDQVCVIATDAADATKFVDAGPGC